MTLSELVWLTLITEVGTLLAVLATALLGKRKIAEVHELVNGKSDKQEETISSLQADIRALVAKKRPGRPRKARAPKKPAPDSDVANEAIDNAESVDYARARAGAHTHI